MTNRRSFLFAGTALASLFLASTTAIATEISPTSSRYQQALEAAASAPAAAAAAAETPPPSKIRVKYREGPQAVARAAAAAALSESVAESSEAQVQATEPAGDNAEFLVLDRALSEEQLREIADDLEANPNVEWAEPEKIERIQQTNDTRFAEQWHYHQADVSVQLEPAWAQSTGTGVVVAVLDTGRRDHGDITAQFLPGFDFVTDLNRSNDGDGRDADATDPGDFCPTDFPPLSSWHGLHVAGTIAAITNNTLGVAGVARDAKILPVRVLGQCGGSSFDISDGIRWAAGAPVAGVPANPTPAKVINLSLGGRGPCDSDYADAISQARQRGATVVVSAGNSDSDASGFRPASCEGVISVAATNPIGARSFFGRGASNFGQIVKIAAPGGETHLVPANGVLSTMNAGLTDPATGAAADIYEFYQGTSMAAPHVAGVAALLYQVNPAIAPDEVLSILQSTSQPFPTVASFQCTTSLCGAGIVNAEAAVAEAFSRVSEGKYGTTDAAIATTPAAPASDAAPAAEQKSP